MTSKRRYEVLGQDLSAVWTTTEPIKRKPVHLHSSPNIFVNNDRTATISNLTLDGDTDVLLHGNMICERTARVIGPWDVSIWVEIIYCSGCL